MIVSNVSLSCGVSCPWGVSDGKTVVTQGGGSGSLSPTGHLVVAVCLGFIGTFGFLNNLLVLTLFCRYHTLRSPINVLLLSVCVSDLLVCVLGTPFSFAAATQGRWLIGRAGCVWYGFINSCLGIVSLISLHLSYERTTCSVDWRTQTPNNISYIVCLFTFCLLLPFSVIMYSYGKLLSAIKQVSNVSTVVTRRREQRVLVMVVTMVACYLLCWLPYGVAALLSTFGPRNLLTPEVTIVPSLLAKTSTVINPVIYIYMNRQSSVPPSRIHGDS
nr:opsin-3-like [Salvelinus alpinus]